MGRNPLSLLRLYLRSCAALRYAARRAGPGVEFGRFGRRLGWQLLSRGERVGVGYLLTPVDIVRYFEFPFAFSCLPSQLGQCLDVSSPRLFSLYVASQFPSAVIEMINPDEQDSSRTAEIVRALKIGNIHVACAAVDSLPYLETRYDCLWSISVAEHVSGQYEDRDAVKWMYDALKPRGRLILTVPVDRKSWDEFREVPYYGTARRGAGCERYFFQHVYDKVAIWERLIDSIGQAPRMIRWFGETAPGTFKAYTERWMRQGDACAVDSPKEILEKYREFAAYEEMPGFGVCGLMIEKA